MSIEMPIHDDDTTEQLLIEVRAIHNELVQFRLQISTLISRAIPLTACVGSGPMEQA